MAALATASDVAARLGSTFTAAEETRVTAILDDVSSTIRAYTGQQFTEATETARLPIRHGKITLPQRPVTAVAAIEDMNGNAVTFVWYLGETIDVAAQVPDVWAWEPYRNGLHAVDVTYTHGYATVPDDIVAVACQVAARAFGTPADTGGLSAETIGEYSYRIGTIAAAGPVGLMPDEKTILDLYRRPVGVTWPT